MAQDEHREQGSEEIAQILGTDRWLLRSGLVTESVKQNLLMYGYLASVLVDEVEVDLDVNEKVVKYWIYLRKSKLRKYERFMKAWEKYKNPVTIWQKWRKLRLFKKNTFMNLDQNLRRFIKDYLPSYSVEIEVLPYGHPRRKEVEDSTG